MAAGEPIAGAIDATYGIGDTGSSKATYLTAPDGVGYEIKTLHFSHSMGGTGGTGSESYGNVGIFDATFGGDVDPIKSNTQTSQGSFRTFIKETDIPFPIVIAGNIRLAAVVTRSANSGQTLPGCSTIVFYSGVQFSKTVVGV